MKRLCLLRERRSSASEAPLLRCADNRCVGQTSAPLLRGMRRRCSPRRSGARITGGSRHAAHERPGEIAQICGTQASCGAVRALPANRAEQRPDGQGRLRGSAECGRVAEQCVCITGRLRRTAPGWPGEIAQICGTQASCGAARVLPANRAEQRPDGCRRPAQKKAPGRSASCMEESVLPRGKAFPAYSVALAAFWMAA